MGVVICVILAAGYFAWRRVTRPMNIPPPPTPQDKIKFFCTRCGKDFDLRRGDDVRRQGAPRGNVEGYLYARGKKGGITGIDCPLCKEEGGADVAVKCDACGKYYLTQLSRWYMGLDTGPEPEPGPPVCPHCGKVYGVSGRSN